MRKFFHVFDESACRWVKTEQEPCLEQSSVISSTILSEAIVTTTIPETTSLTTSESYTSTTQTAILIEDEDDDNGKPVADSCVILDSDWICSNGQNNLSSCFKICSNNAIDHKRCTCKDGACSWDQNGSQCEIKTPTVPNLASPTNSDVTNDVLSTIDQSNSPIADPSGNSRLSNISSLASKTDFSSLIHQINLNNSGNINVNFQLR